MGSPELFRAALYAWFALAAVVFVALLLFPAPYGRHRRSGWGPTLSARAGWVAMEAPAVLAIAAVAALSGRARDPVGLALLLLWELHYVHRAFVSPLRLAAGAAPIPVVIVGMGVLFNVVNGVAQGLWLFGLTPPRPLGWLWSPAFLAGTALFLGGMYVNRRADALLRGLRLPGETGYRIPRGWLYEYVSCPNYLGEILEWVGWAVATASPAGWAFAAWTAANLVPRALAHQRWYRERFPDYPRQRRAIVPFVL